MEADGLHREFNILLFAIGCEANVVFSVLYYLREKGRQVAAIFQSQLACFGVGKLRTNVEIRSAFEIE